MLGELFKYGTVVGVDDPLDGERVKVHIKGVDANNYNIDDIPYAFPLLAKFLHVKPKVGETVFVFSQDGSFETDRFWFGPIISQPHKLNHDSITSKSLLKSGTIKPDIAPSKNPNNVGVNMGNDDVGLFGRGNSELVIKPSEARLRSGKSLDFIKLNKENQSYVQTKYNQTTKESSVNIVGDNVNILSHKSVDKFNLNDPNDLINDDEYKKILEKAHKLPYGDVLIEFMELFKKAFTTHVHAYAGLPTDTEQVEVKNMLNFDLNKILSKNIRIS